eukprot:839044_1
MSNGVISITTVSSFTLITVFSITIIALLVQSIRSKVWKHSETSRKIQIFTISTLSLYSGAAFISWVFFLQILTIGYDLETFDVIPFVTFVFHVLFYIFGLIFTIYIWIKRSQFTFQSTEYAFNHLFLQSIHIIFYALCILGAITVIIFGIGQALNIALLLDLRKIFGILWALLFVTEMFVILYAYMSKLAQLKTSCEDTVRSFDRGVAEVMTKLVAIQMKLSILWIMLIIVTFLCIFCAIVFDPYIEYFPLPLNAFIGFICIYCSVPGHEDVYHRMCGLCLWCCKKYVHSYDELMVLYSMADHKQVNSDAETVPGTALTASNEKAPSVPTSIND